MKYFNKIYIYYFWIKNHNAKTNKKYGGNDYNTGSIRQTNIVNILYIFF